MQRTLIVYNPMSGKQDFVPKLGHVVRRFEEAGYLVETRPTTYHGEAIELARKAAKERYDMLVVVGGDGTFNECVNGLMGSLYRPLIGYIPAGTCCDIGHTLGISKNVDFAIDNILNNQPVLMDVVSSNDRYFCYVSGNGAYIDVSYVTDSSLKKKVGYLAYVVKVAEEIFTIPKIRMRVTHDAGEFRGSYSLILLINSKRVAGINMIYKPKLDDGLLDVVLYRYLWPFNNVIYLLSFILPFWSTPLIKRFQTSELKITTSSRSRWNVDGESGGVGNQVIKVCKQAVRVIVPPHTRKRYFKKQMTDQ